VITRQRSQPTAILHSGHLATLGWMTAQRHIRVPRRLSWAVAGGFAGYALARMTAADRLRLIGIPAASLLPFTPQAAAAAWLCSLLLGDERASAVTAAAAAGLTAALVPRVVARSQPAASGPELRVLTANLLAGRAAVSELVDLVRSTDADVLFVQELSDRAATGLSAVGLDQLLPYAITDLGTREHRGNGIYARHPLSTCPRVMPTSSIQPVVTMKLTEAQVRLACVHLYTPKLPWSRSGAARWRADLAALSLLPTPGGKDDPPLIAAGDFNSTVDHIDFRRLLGHGLNDAAGQAGNGLTPTWGIFPGGRFALLTLDHVLTDDRCAVLGTSVHALRGTDHRAVFARIRLPDLA
jgi:endonuclease/exonuclease/phosphatase family metal-dependent hydrolase